jgi:hypothetical protein
VPRLLPIHPLALKHHRPAPLVNTRRVVEYCNKCVLSLCASGLCNGGVWIVGERVSGPANLPMGFSTGSVWGLVARFAKRPMSVGLDIIACCLPAKASARFDISACYHGHVLDARPAWQLARGIEVHEK